MSDWFPGPNATPEEIRQEQRRLREMHEAHAHSPAEQRRLGWLVVLVAAVVFVVGMYQLAQDRHTSGEQCQRENAETVCR